MKLAIKTKVFLHLLIGFAFVLSVFAGQQILAAPVYSYNIPYEITGVDQTTVAINLTDLARNYIIQESGQSFFFPGDSGTISYNINNTTGTQFRITGFSINKSFQFSDYYWNLYGAGKDQEAQETFFWTDIFTFSLNQAKVLNSLPAHDSMDFNTAFEGYLAGGIAPDSNNTLSFSFDFSGRKMTNEYMACKFNAVILLSIEPYGDEIPASPSGTIEPTPTADNITTTTPTEEVTFIATPAATPTATESEENNLPVISATPVDTQGSNTTASPSAEVSPTDISTATPTATESEESHLPVITVTPVDTEGSNVTSTPSDEVISTDSSTAAPTQTGFVPTSKVTGTPGSHKDGEEIKTGDSSSGTYAVIMLVCISAIFMLGFRRKQAATNK